MPTYDFVKHNRAPTTVVVNPAPVIVVEGLFALFDRAAQDDVAEDLCGYGAGCFILQRDIWERARRKH